MHIEGLLVLLLSVQADKQLVKDVLSCRLLENSLYKSRHPDDTDDPHTAGVSSEDEAEGMEDILGVSRRLNKPSPTEPLPPELAVPEEEGMIKSLKEGLKKGSRHFEGYPGRKESTSLHWGNTGRCSFPSSWSASR